MTPRFLLLLSVLCCSGLAAQTVGDVLINEVLYNSGTNLNASTDYEWVELYNTTGSAINLSGWELRDNTGDYFVPSGTSIAAGGYLVISITANTAEFFDYFGVQPDLDASAAGHGIQLGNSNDSLALFTPAASGNVCIDYIRWGSTGGTPPSGAPAWTGTLKATLTTNTDDATIARVPNGVNGDATLGDAGSEDTNAAFAIAPYTPGRANGLPEVDGLQVADQRVTGAINTLPRDSNDPSRILISLPPSFDFTVFNSTWGSSNFLPVRARYHGTAATVDVSLQVNAGQSTVSAPALTLPASGTLVSGGNNILSGFFNITGQLPAQVGTIVIDVLCTVSSVTTTFQVEIEIDAPQITTSPTLDDILEAQTSQPSIAATGGMAPLSWSVGGAGKPAWVTINSATGQLTMTPPSSSAGGYSFDVTVQDSSTPPRTDMETFTVQVVEVLNITTATLTPIAVGGSSGETIAVAGGTPNYAFSLSGAPAWLNIGAATGTLSGVAPAASAGTYNFNVLVSDAGSPAQNDTQPLSLTVVDSLTIDFAATLPNGMEAAVYNFTCTAVGGQTPYVWSISGQPGFLTINPNTGLLAGTPSNAQSGTYNFDVTVTDSSTPQQTDTLTVTLVIDDLSSGGGGGGGGGGDGGGCVAATGTALPLFAILLIMALVACRRRSSRS